MRNLKEEIQSVVDIYKAGNLSRAEIISKKLLKENPKIVFLYNLLGLILSEQRKINEAISCYSKGIKVDPNYAMNYNNLGQLYFKYKPNLFQKVEIFYKKSISLDKKIPEPHVNLGNLYSSLNKNKKAIECYRKALDINPELTYAYYNLGKVYITIGKIVEAKQNLKKAIEINPNFTLAHRLLSRAVKYTDKDEHFIQLKEIYKTTNKNNIDNKIDLAFSLGKAYEDIKDFPSSFSFYNEANTLHRRKVNFSLTDEKRKFDKIKKIFDKKFLLNYKNSGYLKSSPIFIIGMPRSGTTLIEQILSSHPKVFGADEVEFIPSLADKFLAKSNLQKIANNEIKRIGEKYTIDMRKISGNTERFTDKLPVNFLWIGFIKLILPKSKIIHCHRDSKDNCLSLFKNYFASGKLNFAYDLNEIVKYYNLYLRIMKYWKNLLPNYIYNLKYENLINDTETEIKNLLKICNLDWDDSCLKFYKNQRPIKTASDIQARSKIYSTSINSWKNYEKYLERYFMKLNN